jgi:hypothetical protein
MVDGRCAGADSMGRARAAEYEEIELRYGVDLDHV